MNSDQNAKLNSQCEKFTLLMSQNQRKIYLYVLSAIGSRSIADDIMQQTVLSMWRTFSRFEEGTNFVAWGKAIAKYQILTYRRKEARELFLDNEAFQKILDLYEVVEKRFDNRQEALDGCLKKLNDSNLKLVQMRYHNECSCKEIAKKLNRPITSIYSLFFHIHASLEDCIRKTLAIWETEA